MTNFENIRNAVENIRDHVDNLDCPATENECTDIRCELDDIAAELDDFEPPEQDEISVLIPEGLSAGEVDSLKEAITNWRTEHGYSNN